MVAHRRPGTEGQHMPPGRPKKRWFHVGDVPWLPTRDWPQKPLPSHSGGAGDPSCPVELQRDRSPEPPLPYPGGKWSTAALAQVVLMVRRGNGGCRLFHRYGEATSSADRSALVDISETRGRRGKAKHYGIIPRCYRLLEKLIKKKKPSFNTLMCV